MEKIKKYDGIILDIDGTIWNTTEVVASAWNKAIVASGLAAKKVDAPSLQKEFGKTMDVIASDLWPELGEKEKKYLMDLCCSYEQKELEECNWNICYPNVVESIKALSADYDFYVVSNCQKGYIELMLKKTGLEPCIKDFECYGNTLKGKAENLRAIVGRNKLKSPLYVGDTQGDCDSCRQVGVPFVWASYGFGKADSCLFELSDFSLLEKILG